MFPKSGLELAPEAFLVTLSPAAPFIGGGDRNRTDDRLVANQVLYQLSYAPGALSGLVGLGGIALPTSRLSGGRSNY